ncbi:MAG: tyrosine-type recombinase/integrase [Minicystis sp.]
MTAARDEARRARIHAAVDALLDALFDDTEPAPAAPAPTAPAVLVDKREVARTLGVSVATVDRLDREGQPFIRVGDVKRYDLAAVLAWHRDRLDREPDNSCSAVGFWYARITVDHGGKTVRDWYTLDTSDFATAQRRKEKLLKELAAGRGSDAAATAAGAPDTVATYAASLGKRLSDGDHMNLRVHVLKPIGQLALDEVKPAHVKSIRDTVIAAGARRGTAGKVLGAVRRLYAAAIEDELVEHNPAADVRLPKQRGAEREIVKPRMILNDDEIACFLACDHVDLELRMLSLVARCEGGMRTSDLHAWDWTMIDVQRFATCTIPRSKTAAPEALDVPEVLRPFLRAWWERAGRPIAGPVFPVRIGPRAGERKARMNSYAERLRRDLFRAGVVRMPPVEVPIRKQGMRTDLGKRPEGTMLAPNPHDPLYFETPTSLPVDFHSFRRAFNTALATAGVNTQKAMKLAGHSDPKTHMRYVMDAPEMRTIPEAALPRLPAVPIRAQSRRSTVNHRGSGGEAEGGDNAQTASKPAFLSSPSPLRSRGSEVRIFLDALKIVMVGWRQP